MANRRMIAFVTAALVAIGTSVALIPGASADQQSGSGTDPGTATPIKHLVVIFQENVSFDHYFGTYPHAKNPSGEPQFHPAPGTPTVNGLSAWLLNQNPNGANPQRLDRSDNYTCDQNHDYTAEQAAFDRGLMDKFVPFTSGGGCNGTTPATSKTTVMNYYDGNTVTGLWNYAQNFAMSDNSYSDTFGPSTPGAFNVTAGNTYGAICGPNYDPTSTTSTGTPPTYNSDGTVAKAGSDPATINDHVCTTPPGTTTQPQGSTPPADNPQGPGTVLSDADPNYDICSTTQPSDHKTAAQTIQMGGQNIGDLLNQNHTTWGWFQGGFADPNYTPGNPSSDDLSKVCTGYHMVNETGGPTKVYDYNPHHAAFQYWQQTANPQHLPPTSISMIGRQDQANHQYDLKDFWAAADNGNMPAVSYLKAASYQDGHAGYSSPLDEQQFLVNTINHLERLPTWKSTAVVIAYDDSDGWYDHQMSPTVTHSQTPFDVLSAPGKCGNNPPPGPGQQGRCGLGMRQPLLVISPFSRQNFVDNTLTTQSSVVRFIEDNWTGGQRIPGGSNDAQTNGLRRMFDFSQPSSRRLFLDPATGQPGPPGQER
jgi:phospholipase C